MNKVTISGNLGSDPKMSAKSEAGNELVFLNVATNRDIKNKETGEYESKSTWHDVVCWGHTAKYIGQYGKKGDFVVIEGTLEYWEDQNSESSNVRAAKIRAFDVELINSRGSRQSEAAA